MLFKEKALKIAIKGATGFIGGALCLYFQRQGHEVFPIGRDHSLPAFKFDAVVHLAAEPISFSRWSQTKKQKILASRVEGTFRLIEQFSHPPAVFICASAIGYYGDRKEELLTEKTPPGSGFLSHVCVEWEKAACSVLSKVTRSIQTRFGVVLGKGGALQKMVGLYKLGLGATLGNGEQWVSWIHIDDLLRAIDHLILHSSIQGPVNVVSPGAVRQWEFSQTLASVLHRPTWLKIPKWIVELCLGTMGEEMLLASAHVRSAKLLDAGFTFRYTQLEDALRSILLR